MLLLVGEDDTKCLMESEEAHTPESYVSATGKSQRDREILGLRYQVCGY